MSVIVTRAIKGSPLTHTEMDANFTNLNNDKLEASALTPYATTASVTAGLATKIDSSAIGVTVQPYDATILNDADIGVNIQPYDATILKNANIGTTVQGYDADTAKTDVAQNFTSPQRSALLTDNDGSFDLSAKQNFKCTTAGAITLTFTNQADGLSGSVVFINSSNHVISAHANTKLVAADLTKIQSSGTYRIDYLSDGTNAYCSVVGAYA